MILPMQSRTHQMWRLVFNLAKDAWMTTRCTSYSAYSASILLKSLCLMDLEDLASLNGTSFRAEIRSLRGRSRWSSSEVPNFCRRRLVEPSFIEAEPSEHSVILNPHQHTSSWIPAFAAEHSRNVLGEKHLSLQHSHFRQWHLFLLLDYYWSTAKAWPASAMFFEHVEHPRTQVLKRQMG